MVRVEVERTIGCTPEVFLEFVMDVDRYTEVDDKIGPITWVRRHGDMTEFKFQPKLPGLSLPEPKSVSQMRLTPGERIDVRLAPPPHNKINRRMSEFSASWTTEAVDGGTHVTRMISFDFNPVVGWMFEPVLRRTLPESLERELRLAKKILEPSTEGTP
jgi:hypothetical protein